MTKTKIEKLTRERDRERVCFCSQFTYLEKKRRGNDSKEESERQHLKMIMLK